MSRSDTEVMTPEATLDIMKYEATRNFLTPESYFKAFCNWLPLKNNYNSWKTIARNSTLLVCSGRLSQGHCNIKCRSFSYSSILRVPYGVRLDINFHGTETIDLFSHLNLHFGKCVKMVENGARVALLIDFPQSLKAEDVKECLKSALGNTYKTSFFRVEYDYITEEWLSPPHITSAL